MHNANNFFNKALLIHIDNPIADADNSHNEFTELALSANVKIQDVVSLSKKKYISTNLFIGKGDANFIERKLKNTNVKLVIFNIDLSPTQERNLENLFSARVLDRTGLILDIFSQRAMSHEGKLQVELAQLNYLATRLVRGWSHLERQKGGIGLRGPGETQLETDRRLLRARIINIEKRLKKVSNQRELSRNLRQKRNIPRISIVGYTNAGKSTLFNCLTGANTLSADKLFATLDPIHRKIILNNKKNAVISDTVGFIRNLPHHLIESFKSTLLEVTNSNLLIHVVDLSDNSYPDYIKEVDSVLKSIGADKIPKILVFNKVDQNYNPENFSHLQQHSSCYISAKTGYGIEFLKNIISKRLFENYKSVQITLPRIDSKIRSHIYEKCIEVNETFTKSGQWKIKFMANRPFIKYLDKSGIINKKVEKKSRNSQEIYKTG